MAVAEDKSQNESQEEPLTEAQRIDKLEKNVGTSKLVLMLVALLLIVVISVSVTAFAVFVAKGDKKDGAEIDAQFESMQTEIMNLKARVDEKEVVILNLQDKIKAAQNQLKSSGNTVLIDLMIEQEKDNQSVLAVARSSIYDLSHMVPGSRTWLESYTEELDRATEYSKARQKKLAQLSSGEVAAEPESSDDGFGDF